MHLLNQVDLTKMRNWTRTWFSEILNLMAKYISIKKISVHLTGPVACQIQGSYTWSCISVGYPFQSIPPTSPQTHIHTCPHPHRTLSGTLCVWALCIPPPPLPSQQPHHNSFICSTSTQWSAFIIVIIESWERNLLIKLAILPSL